MSGTRSPIQQKCFAAHDADAKRRISTAVTCQTLLLVTQYHYLGGVLVGEWPFEQEIIIFSAVNDIAAITVMSSRSADHTVLVKDSRSSSLAGNSRDLDRSELSSLVADVKMIRSWETSLIFYLPPLPPPTRHANHAGDDNALAFDHGRYSDREAA